MRRRPCIGTFCGGIRIMPRHTLIWGVAADGRPLRRRMAGVGVAVPRQPVISVGLPNRAGRARRSTACTLLVHAEQGIGDMLQFCRFRPTAARGGRLLVEVHRPLVGLLAQLPGVAGTVGLGDPLPPFDVQCPMLSLPYLSGMASERDIPPEMPYLRPEPSLVDRWRSRTAALSGLRVGLVWAQSGADADGPPALGRPQSPRLPARCVRRVVRIAAEGRCPGGADRFGTGHCNGRLTGELTDFGETAALVKTLDLVIGVDTAVVHLAGAMGKPVWLLNRFDTCWRWLRDRDDSP